MTRHADLQIAFIGSGGDGMQAAGEALTFAAAAHGTNSLNIKLFGPAVKGGTSASITRIGEHRIENIKDTCDVVVLFSRRTLDVFRDQIGYDADTLFIVDEEESAAGGGDPLGSSSVVLPMKREVKALTGASVGGNVFAVAAIQRMLGLFPEHMADGLRWCFRNKRRQVRKSAMAVYEHAVNWLQRRPDLGASRTEFAGGPPLAVLNGNESAVLGALAAGCDFYAGYPITPATYSMELFSSFLVRRGGKFLQAEDEIAAVMTAIGASYAGARPMVATSGPGLSLMQEGLGLAYMAEIPLVVLNVQRGGPSTGLPTLTEQSDLHAALHGSHGDAPRVVLAPKNILDCFSLTKEAFRIAEEYQMPVIVLSDAYLSTRLETVPRDQFAANGEEKRARRRVYEGDPAEFRRYELTEDGVSPTSTPGEGGIPHLISGLEHDERGWPSITPDYHRKMNDKRYRKIIDIHEKLFSIDFHGDRGAPRCVLCFGSCWGALCEAVDRLAAEGARLALASPLLLYSHPGTALDASLARFEKLMVVELSGSAQFFRYLSSNFELPGRVALYNRPGGSPFLVEELVHEIRSGLLDD